jgi:cation diffusion facilitator family transporter
VSPLGHIPTAERRLALLSIAVGVSLMGLKFAAYFITGSTALFSDALESIVNVIAGFVSLGALSYAHRPPDASHPYGHGKAEFVSGGLEGAMILVASAAIAFTSVRALLDAQTLENARLGLLLAVVALFANGVLGLALVRLGRAKHSLTLEADGRHLLTDAVTSVAAVVGVALVALTGRAWIDPAVALAIALLIAAQGVRLIRRSAAGLMDALDPADDDALRGLLDDFCRPAAGPLRVCGYHKLRHRHVGRHHWVDFHLQLPGDFDVRQSHAIAGAIEATVEAALGEADATAHVEPCDDPACDRCRGDR